MAILSVADYVKHTNIREALTKKIVGDELHYFYQGLWVTKAYLDELLPIDLPFPENSKKGSNAEVKRRFIHNEKSY